MTVPIVPSVPTFELLNRKGLATIVFSIFDCSNLSYYIYVFILMLHTVVTSVLMVVVFVAFRSLVIGSFVVLLSSMLLPEGKK
jgi:hypothetical protein